MKLLAVCICLIFEQVLADPLVGQPAPEFTAQAVVEGEVIDDFTLKNYQGQYVILLFYPLDFTFVCPTELHAFQDQIQEFQARNAQVIACSVDSPYTHLAWLNTSRVRGGIEGVTYPILSDLDKSISYKFGVLDPVYSTAYRGLFLIDKEGIIRHQLINDFPIGRSVNETLRVLDALITVEEYGEVCPANWNPGSRTFFPTQKGLLEYFEES